MTRDENRDGCGAVLGWALRILGLAGVCVPALEVTAPLFTAPGINFPRYINIANQQMANKSFQVLAHKGRRRHLDAYHVDKVC
jgi:hypothetical protein